MTKSECVKETVTFKCSLNLRTFFLSDSSGAAAKCDARSYLWNKCFFNAHAPDRIIYMYVCVCVCVCVYIWSQRILFLRFISWRSLLVIAI